jgi:hypothetical protein
MNQPSQDGEIQVTFHPQEWVDSPGKAHESGRKQLISAPERDEVAFVVSEDAATDQDGNLHPDESYKANQLQSHPDAPEWVNNWDGPYFVTTSWAED